jgi:hypothetical protein
MRNSIIELNDMGNKQAIQLKHWWDNIGKIEAERRLAEKVMDDKDSTNPDKVDFSPIYDHADLFDSNSIVSAFSPVKGKDSSSSMQDLNIVFDFAQIFRMILLHTYDLLLEQQFVTVLVLFKEGIFVTMRF